MIGIEEARQYVLEQAQPRSTETVSLSEGYNRILRQAAVSDIDSPPHDKALMDGFAIRSADVAAASASLHVVEQITAGDVPRRTLQAGECARIMTGAPIPTGADAVIMIEQAEAVGHATPKDRTAVAQATDVVFPEVRVSPGQNIMRRAASLAKGETVLAAGCRLGSAEIGLLAEIGHVAIEVAARPQVSILATGNELVPPDQRPEPGQIRNSNSSLLHALTCEAGGTPHLQGIAPDDAEELRAAIAAGLEHDVLILSGGVSAGVLDLVPAMLAECGVEPIFHKVRLKPGKPIFFGVRRQTDRPATLVFGLPGNPVSSLVGFHLFVRPALQAMMTGEAEPRETATARLAQAFSHRGGRPTYWPAKLLIRQGILEASPLDWKGSADQKTVAAADGFVYFPEPPREYQPGDVVEVLGNALPLR